MDVTSDDLVGALGAGNYFLLASLSVMFVVMLLRRIHPDFFKGWVTWATAVLLGAAQAVALASQSGHAPAGGRAWFHVVLGGALSGALGSGLQSGAVHVRERMARPGSPPADPPTPPPLPPAA